MRIWTAVYGALASLAAVVTRFVADPAGAVPWPARC